MDLRVLRYFLAVAKEGNLSKAAEFLCVTQPTLSRQLMELEEELGAKLFIRGGRKIVLTESGTLLRKRAEEILELVQKAKGELTNPQGPIAGDIYIGGGETEAMRFIAKIGYDIRTSCPGINFNIFSGNADDVLERLEKGLLDFGILIEPSDISKYDSVRLPFTDVWGVLMRKDNPLASKTAAEPEDLRNVPLIVSRQSMGNRQIAEWIKKDYDKLNIAATYNLIYNAALMTEEGIGIALSLDRLINTETHKVLCFRPLKPRLEARLYMVWKKYQTFSKPANLFLKTVRETLGSLPS